MLFPTVDPQSAARFSRDFRFGVADADLQVIGEKHTLAEEGSAPTMWRNFTTERGLETPDEGVDRFHRWQEDIELMQRLGVRHYRTSVSMSRTLHPDGSPNEQGIAWYRRYFEALRKAGIAVYATMYHWELPQYSNERGGWTNRETAHTLQKHAGVVAEHLGDLIDEFFLLNEPWCSSFLSYYENIHAPGNQSVSSRENLRDALLAAHHLLLAQGLAYRAIVERRPDAKVSTVFNFQPSYTLSAEPADRQAALYRDGYYNAWFMGPTYIGRYPEWMMELFGDLMPEGYQDDMDTIKIGNRLHALGVNYYRGGLYKGSSGDLMSDEIQYSGGPTNSLDWPIFRPPFYPEGLYDILQQIYFGYRAFGLNRLYITENGMALTSEWDGASGGVEDAPRIEYIREHVQQVYRAILHGIPVEAYFSWTLMDNFEWAEGYRKESAFGMTHVDRATLKRVPKTSAGWYGRLLQTHSLDEADSSIGK